MPGKITDIELALGTSDWWNFKLDGLRLHYDAHMRKTLIYNPLRPSNKLFAVDQYIPMPDENREEHITKLLRLAILT